MFDYLLVVDELLRLGLREPLLSESCASRTTLGPIAAQYCRSVAGMGACLLLPLTTLSGFAVLAVIVGDVLLLWGRLGVCCLRTLGGPLLLNALRHGLEVQERLLGQVLARRRLVYLLRLLLSWLNLLEQLARRCSRHGAR